jgi:site-specific DNA-methyltransferase (cytosine-N4-specific)
MGEFLKMEPKNKGGGDGSNQHRRATPSKKEGVATPTRADIGIDYKESSEAQALHDMKETEPARHEQVRQGQIGEGTAINQMRRERKKRQRAAEDKVRAESVPVICAEDKPDLYQEDCLSFFKRQPAGSIDLVFGSPPYENARLYLEDGADLGIARDTDAWVKWMVEVYREALRACKGLVAFVAEGNTTKYRWSAAPVLLMAELHRAGISLRKPPIYKRNGIAGSGGPDWLRNDYEFIVCATNGGRLPWSDNTAIGHAPKYGPGGEFSHRQRDDKRVNDRNGYAKHQDRLNEGHHRARMKAGRVYEPPEKANPGNIINCGSAGGGNMGNEICHENEAPFPEKLAEFFVRSFCPPGGIVCDPFMGSGTTGEAALRWGRRFVGCDLRQSQVELTRRRLALVVAEVAHHLPQDGRSPAETTSRT